MTEPEKAVTPVPCATCGGKGRVPGMVMLDRNHGAGWGEVWCPDCSTRENTDSPVTP